tara:strand:+ start:2564 stop:2743 length:180 start_codon:yes stop_codon:yes gene_type:complete
MGNSCCGKAHMSGSECQEDCEQTSVEQKLIEHLESNHIEASKNRVKIIMNFINKHYYET